jgi:GNAT superfamily N-acetyltransferase
MGIMTTVIATGKRPVWGVDRARPDDRPRLEAMFAGCSAETIHQRFFGRPATWPSAYLAGVLAGRPAVHDAVVVRWGDGLHVAALASLVAGGASADAAELGVLVTDAWQGCGLGRAVVQTLVDRARGRGVEVVTASVLADRTALLTALARRYRPVSWRRSADEVTGSFRLLEEGGAT